MSSVKEGLLLILLVSCSTLILVYVDMIDAWSFTAEPILFWLPVVLAAAAVFYAALMIDSKFPVLLVLILAVTLHLVPIVRQPPGIASYTNAPYNLELAEHVLNTGRWDFGYGTSAATAREFSYFPPMFLLQAMFSLILNIPSMTVEKYLIPLVNALFVVTFYVFVRRFTDSPRLANIAVAFYMVNPMFYSQGAYAHSESYAIVLFPLVLSYFLVQKGTRTGAAVFIILLGTIAWTHHFTSYMIVLGVLAAYVLQKISGNVRISTRSLAFVLAFPAAWLSLIALFVLTTHITMLQIIFSNIAVEFRPVGFYSSAVPMWYPNDLARFLVTARNVTLVILTAFALLEFMSRWKEVPKPRWRNAFQHYVRHCGRLADTPSRAFLTALLLSFSSLAFAAMFMVQWGASSSKGGGLGFGDIRIRVTEFLFVPLSVFSAYALASLGARRFRRIAVIIILASVVLIPAGIINAYPRDIYNQGYQPIQSSEYTVEPVEKFALGIWVRQTVAPTTKTFFTGSFMGTYIDGYGHQPGGLETGLYNVTVAETRACEGITVFYTIDRTNTIIPDAYRRTVDSSTLQVLISRSGRVYDSGNITLYLLPFCEH
jgi:hypothetical protein